MTRVLLVLLTAASLAACQTTTPAQRLAENRAACETYGFTPGTDALAQCVLTLETEANRASEARRAASLASMQTSFRPPVTCQTTTSITGNTTTVCQ